MADGRPRTGQRNSSARTNGGAVRKGGRRRPPARPPARRLVALLLALSLGLTGILARLVLLQVKDASALQALALNQRARSLTIPARRGAILDRNGEALAMSLPAKAVFADPVLVRDAPSEAATLAGALQMDLQTVYNAITQPGRFAYVARGVDPDVAKALASLNLPGIGFINESRRFYPAGALAP